MSTATRELARRMAPDELAPFAIACRPRMGEWQDADTSALLHARLSYNAGTHELAQGYSAGMCVQYSIPRRERVNRHGGWFTPGHLSALVANG